MKLSFHGAAHEVTGSCYFVECAGRRILVDCGLFQGSQELEETNARAFGFDARAVDYLLLTHAHLDHCGRIPLLARRGFHGEIVATSATRDLARLVLLDAARLEEEEIERKRRQGAPKARPLYTTLDALDSLDLFRRRAEYGRRIEICEGVAATFYDAGHILGSASILLELDDGAASRRIVFSGDLGSSGRPLLHEPQSPPAADLVVMETTYGDRNHRSLADSVRELYAAISDAVARRGNIIIPSFALERTQELLFHLREGIEANLLPPDLQIYLDSPMAISATEIFARHPECHSPRLAHMLAQGRDPFDLPNLHMCRDIAQSRALNEIDSGALIIAGSGMCTGGRVRHHLLHNLDRPESAVIFVGFAAEGTLARTIIDGAKYVRLFGRVTPVRARIHTINGFSAHADRDELLAWRRKIAALRTILTHGDPAAMDAFARSLGDGTIETPRLGDKVTL